MLQIKQLDSHVNLSKGGKNISTAKLHLRKFTLLKTTISKKKKTSESTSFNKFLFKIFFTQDIYIYIYIYIYKRWTHNQRKFILSQSKSPLFIRWFRSIEIVLFSTVKIKLIGTNVTNPSPCLVPREQTNLMW